MKSKLSVSLVCYNQNEVELCATISSLLSCLDLLEQVQLFIIDHSNISSLSILDEVLRNKNIDFFYFHNHLNPGFGAGHNKMLSANSEYHLVLNPDIELAPESLKIALDFMRENSSCGLLSPFATWADGEVQRLCKNYPTVLDFLLRGFAPAFIRDIFKDRLAKYEMVNQINESDIYWDPPIVSGCFMLFRTDIFKLIGGFDPRFFLYFEDFDISLRTAQVSRIAYVPQVRIVHHGGHASRKGWKHIKIFCRSMITFFNIHGWRWW